jgi:hypothetical protein
MNSTQAADVNFPTNATFDNNFNYGVDTGEKLYYLSNGNYSFLKQLDSQKVLNNLI